VSLPQPRQDLAPSRQQLPVGERLEVCCFRDGTAGALQEPTDGCELRGSEITSLRREVTTLLRTNGQLHAQLNRLNVPDRDHFPEPMALMPSVAGPVATTHPSEAVGENADAKSSFASWIEDRKSLEDRVMQLTEECRALELEKTLLGPQHGNVAGPCSFMPAAAEQHLPMPASLLRERDDLRQRLRTAELANCAAEQRRKTAEATLERTLRDLDTRRQQLHFAANNRVDEEEGPLLQEISAMKQELAEAQRQLEETDRSLTAKNEELGRDEKEQDHVREDAEGLAAANAALMAEMTATRERLATEQLASRGVEAQLTKLRAELRSRRLSHETEISGMKSRAESLENTLRQGRAALEASEVAAMASRVEERQLRANLEVIRTAHSEAQVREEQNSHKDGNELLGLQAEVRAFSAEREELATRLQEARNSAKDTEACEEERVAKCEKTVHELDLQRTVAAEQCRRSQLAVAEAEQRVETLLHHLREERQQNLEFSQELCCMEEEAEEAAALARGGRRRSPGLRRMRSAAASVRQQRDLGAVTSRSGSPGGWATSASHSQQLHRELELLQRWKGDALRILQQMRGEMDSVQGQYRQQLKYNQTLQERLDWMGHQARAVIAGTLYPQPGGCSAGVTAEPVATAPAAAAAAAAVTFQEPCHVHLDDSIGSSFRQQDLLRSTSCPGLAPPLQQRRERQQHGGAEPYGIDESFFHLGSGSEDDCAYGAAPEALQRWEAWDRGSSHACQRRGPKRRSARKSAPRASSASLLSAGLPCSSRGRSLPWRPG